MLDQSWIPDRGLSSHAFGVLRNPRAWNDETIGHISHLQLQHKRLALIGIGTPANGGDCFFHAPLAPQHQINL